MANTASLISAGEAKSAAAPARAVVDDEKDEGDDICSICLEAMPWFGRGTIWFTCCGNNIHEECAEQFGRSRCSKNCPMCRAPIVSSVQNHTQALRWARKDKAWAMSFVGDNFCRGRGVSLSKEMARLWYEKAAEQGHGGAQCMLARMHLYGEGGLPVSKEKARLLYEKAAEQGLHQGQHNLGVMHYLGQGGLPVSKEKALLWLKRAAEQGYEDATTLIDTDFKNKCFSCGKTGAMKCCSRCKCAYYCSQECQAAAWKSGHKATCKQIRRMQKTKK